ncbi:MAG TPA: ATP-binding protein [Candidatus Limnocylindrales bacterium]|nr:ATP-binding protein [Candidatus Limnocylindrales bacterium]
MSRARVLAVEPSLDDEWGIPYPASRGRVRALRRLALGVVAVAALVAGGAATAVSLIGRIDAGVVISNDGDRVISVAPSGIGWRDGIRAGQAVIAFADSDAPGGWRLETEGDGQRYEVVAAAADKALREYVAFGIVATLLGGLAVVLLRGHRRWVSAAACCGLVAAVPLLEASGRVGISTLSMGAAALAPAIWIAWRPRLPIAASAALTGITMVVIAAWTVARLGALPTYWLLEDARAAVAFFGTGLVVIGSVFMPLLWERPATGNRQRIGEVLLVAVPAGLAIGILAVTSQLAAIGILVVAILAVPAWRRWFAARAERTLLADVRDHARLEATETERAHLARELHDVPLQELAGIIRRLELLPEARAETDQLRAVAAQLRGVATKLRPPVLDDLGLAPALDFLAETASTDLVAVTAEVEDRTSLEPGGRPPAEVELAVFRIAQEAVANACRHAQASNVRLRGEVGPGRVALAVTDDGRGLDEAEARAASRRGRLGLASIRRRAEAIDAELDISGSAAGTSVAVRWAR